LEVWAQDFLCDSIADWELRVGEDFKKIVEPIHRFDSSQGTVGMPGRESFPIKVEPLSPIHPNTEPVIIPVEPCLTLSDFTALWQEYKQECKTTTLKTPTGMSSVKYCILDSSFYVVPDTITYKLEPTAENFFDRLVERLKQRCIAEDK